MLGLFPSHGRCNRRQVLKMSVLAAGLGGSWRDLVASEAAHSVPSHRPTATRCIYIFLCGGPSQNDLWDLKPDAPAGIRTLFEPAQTNVPGILFGSLIP